MSEPSVNIISSFTWHDDAHIVGNREGLMAVRDAIDEALDAELARANVFAPDGEGYNVVIVRVSEKAAWGLPAFYWDESAGRNCNPTLQYVWKLILRLRNSHD